MEKRSDLVREVDADKNVFELRRLTGFTWERLADLLNVDPKTIHQWVKVGEIREANWEHIAETLSVLQDLNRGLAEDNAVAIDRRQSTDETPFDAIKAGRYLEARQYLSHDHASLQPALPEFDLTQWIGEFQPMVMHEGADGFETIEPLPNKPKPVSRKKRIKRI